MTKIANATVYKIKYNVKVADDIYGWDSEDNGKIIRMDMEAVAALIQQINGGIEQGDFIYNEVPTGIVNGVNNTFISLNNFIPEKVEVYVNGVLQKIINDYQTIGNNTITLNASPTTGENIVINYIKL